MQTDTGELSGILERTKTLMGEEEALRQKMQWLRWIFPSVILSIFALYFFLFYSTITNVETDKFFSKLERNMVRVWPIFGDEFKRVAAEVSPVYATEIEKAVIDSLPELEGKVRQQMESRVALLRDKLTEDLSVSLKSLYQKQKAIIHREIPELKQDEKATGDVIRAVNSATISWVEGLLSQAIQDHAVALLDLKEVLDSNYRKADGKEAKIDSEQLLSLWVEVMDRSLGGQELRVEPKNKAKKRSKK